MFETLAKNIFSKYPIAISEKIFTYLLNSRSIAPIKNTCRKSGNIFCLFYKRR